METLEFEYSRMTEIVILDSSEVSEYRDDIGMVYTLQVIEGDGDARNLYCRPTSDAGDADVFFADLPVVPIYSHIGINSFSAFIYICIVKMIGLEDTLPRDLDINALYSMHVGKRDVRLLNSTTVKFVTCMKEHYNEHISKRMISIPVEIFDFIRIPHMEIHCDGRYYSEKSIIITDRKSLIIAGVMFPGLMYNIDSGKGCDTYIQMGFKYKPTDYNINLLGDNLSRYYDSVRIKVNHENKESTWSSYNNKSKIKFGEEHAFVIKVTEDLNKHEESDDERI